MPFVSIDDFRLSDLVLSEEENLRSRDVVSVTNTAGGVKAAGTVIWRAKGTDPTAQWDVVDAAADLGAAGVNEFGIIIGDSFSPAASVTLGAGVAKNVIAIVREADVKESILKTIHQTGGFTAGNFATLKHFLKNQGVIVRDSIAAYATTP
jgi:hypothetical protein